MCQVGSFGSFDVNGDAHIRVVAGFRDAKDAWESMGDIRVTEDVGLAAWLQRHRGRARRNAHRVIFARTRLMMSRSIGRWGSQQAADVAAQRVVANPTLLDELMRRTTTPPPSGGKKP